MRYLFAMFLLFLVGCSTQPSVSTLTATDKEAHEEEMNLYSDTIIIDDCGDGHGRFPRVEIGNAPTFRDCTRLEIQIPSYWTNDQIIITVNQGGFQDGETGYLFVINTEGCINSVGFPVVFGSPGVIPGQPLELRLSL